MTKKKKSNLWRSAHVLIVERKKVRIVLITYDRMITHKHRTGIQCVTLSSIRFVNRGTFFFSCVIMMEITSFIVNIKSNVHDLGLYLHRHLPCLLFFFVLCSVNEKSERMRKVGESERSFSCCVVLHPYFLNSDNNFIRIPVLGFTRPYRSISFAYNRL